MGKIRRQYTAEFKREAVALVTEQGYAVTAAARNFGVNPNLLHRWKANVQRHQAVAFPGQGHQRPDQTELRQLREENRRLRYVLETDVPASVMDALMVGGRYRDLQAVERDFLTLKTTPLEVPPIFLRTPTRTRGHVFVAMVALKIVREFRRSLVVACGTTPADPHKRSPLRMP